ncbi:hypothetical protein [Brachybacterium alimentarium]|uniref:hypothetical protein n=1 Tax=Brachybacterium alimentarium TaxID=47845 RepID=UPI000DF4AE5E|nr:hypothetical protein [Brachybacterium alimentarium]RCS81827.1 hypothetical protein CIK67_15635 [Brachybacterium alimentarium]
MPDLTIQASPVMVYRRDAAVMLATSEKRVIELVRDGYLTERYPDSKPRYLVSELEEYARSLPTERKS